MKNPLPLIEFVVFIGVVIWLFTLPSSPLSRRSRDGAGSDKDDHKADGG
jgi:hypothetical protein